MNLRLIIYAAAGPYRVIIYSLILYWDIIIRTIFFILCCVIVVYMYSLSVDCICHTVSISVLCGYIKTSRRKVFFRISIRRIIPDVIYLCCCRLTPRVSFFNSRAMLSCSFTPRIGYISYRTPTSSSHVLCYHIQQAIAVGCCLYIRALFFYNIIIIYRNSYIAHLPSVECIIFHIWWGCYCCCWGDAVHDEIPVIGRRNKPSQYYHVILDIASMTRPTLATTFSLGILNEIRF